MHTLELQVDPVHPLHRQLERVRECLIKQDSIFADKEETKKATQAAAQIARDMFEAEFPEFNGCRYQLLPRRMSREQPVCVYIYLPVSGGRPSQVRTEDA